MKEKRKSYLIYKFYAFRWNKNNNKKINESI